MKMKSTKGQSANGRWGWRLMMYPAFHSGMKVLRHFSDPMRMKMEADPINKIAMPNKTLTIMPVIRILRRRFLRAFSVSRMYLLRMAFISLKNSSMISLTVGS
jgi:hypothetical protein